LKPKAIVFDLDDTLYLEEDFVRSGFGAVAHFVSSKFGIDRSMCLDELVRLHDEGVRRNTFDVWKELLNVAEDQSTEELVNVYRHHVPNITPFPLVIDLLCSLRTTNYKVGLITDGYRDTQALKVKALDIACYFDAIVLSDVYGRENWKPAPLPYLEVLKSLFVEPADSVYVGDNPKKDFLGARGVGMKSIRIRHERGIYSALEPETNGARPDVELQSLHHLTTVISELL